MKTIFTLFFAICLSSCTVYTITNKVDKDFKIKKAGGSEMTLKALECVELREFFLGLGGDFPFFVVGGAEEYSAGYYELKLHKQDHSKKSSEDIINNKYVISSSKRNKVCQSSALNKEDKKVNNDVPICGSSTIKAICKNGNSKCVMNAAQNNKEAICINDENKKLNIKPFCKQSTVKPVCIFTSKVKINPKKQAFCLEGSVKCSVGKAKCVDGKNNTNIVYCVNSDDQKLNNISTYCDDGKMPICLESIVTVTLSSVNPKIPQCGIASQAICISGGSPICGFTKTDNKPKPYCVNKDNIRWVTDVRCSGEGGEPNCDTISIAN